MIQVLERAFNILETLGRKPDNKMPLSAISNACGLDKGTCTRILKTLQEGGYVQQNSPRGDYKIGYKVYHLIGRPVENEELTKTARKDIEDLGGLLNETALLAVVNNDKRVVLYSTTPDRNLVVRTNLERGVYSVCAGRVIIANYTSAHLDRFIIRTGLPSKEDWPQIYESSDPEKELINQLVRIKQRGYDVLDDGHGIIGFAAPLFRGGHVAGCVGVYLPVERMKSRKAIIDAVLDCAGRINQKIEITGRYEV